MENTKDVVPGDPVARWRNSYQRDRSAFERAHGRKPMTLAELSAWLPPIPDRSDRTTRRSPDERH